MFQRLAALAMGRSGCSSMFLSHACVPAARVWLYQACYSRFKATRMALVGAAGGAEMSEVERLRAELRQAQEAASSAAGKLAGGGAPR
jgi:hypothetical protein